jgi:hypothetical protein
MALLPSMLVTDANPAMMLVRVGFLGAMVAVELVEIATAALSHLDSTAAMTFLVLNLTAGGAAGFTGALLGFIFGVPKTYSAEAPPSPVGLLRARSAPRGAADPRERTPTRPEQRT